MTKAELKQAALQWLEWNKGRAQAPEARYFAEQVQKWGEGIQVLRCKDIKEGLSILLECDGVAIDGILDFQTGEWIDKVTDLGPTKMTAVPE